MVWEILFWVFWVVVLLGMLMTLALGVAKLRESKEALRQSRKAPQQSQDSSEAGLGVSSSPLHPPNR